jgi:hypothetical protein
VNKVSDWSIGAKSCAQQIFHEAFDNILCGKFNMPTQKDLENTLKAFIDYEFDEYEVAKKIIAKHPNWDDEQIDDEIYRVKMRYDKEYRDNLNKATLEAIAEIENLLTSLNDSIRAWKIKNLGNITSKIKKVLK